MSATSRLDDPQALYRHWEDEQWNPWSIDLAADREQWHGAMADEHKGLVYWALPRQTPRSRRCTDPTVLLDTEQLLGWDPVMQRIKHPISIRGRRGLGVDVRHRQPVAAGDRVGDVPALTPRTSSRLESGLVVTNSAAFPSSAAAGRRNTPWWSCPHRPCP